MEIIDSFWKKNGTMDKMSETASYLGQARSDNAFDRMKGLTGLVAKLLSIFGM